MIQSNFLRRFAAWLLELGRRFSPPSLQDWAEAMRTELDFIEGNWPALAWAAGGAGVLMRRSLIHFVTGRSRESGQLRFGPQGGPMRKVTVGFAILGTVILGVLLFAPSFRQAVSVSADSMLWGIFPALYSEGDLGAMADKARAKGDAETLAFVALESDNPSLTEEVIKLDPKLTWICYLQASRYMWRGGRALEAGPWAKKLVAWDPDNAVPHLLEAQLEALRVSNGNMLALSPDQFRSDERWMSAMKAGFAAKKYDSYFDTRIDLYRRVMARQHLANPLIILRAYSSHPIPYLMMLQRYAHLTYEKGADLEKKGDLEGASNQYWTVARFGQTMHLEAATDIERFYGAVLQREAYQKLEPVAARAGHATEQALLAYEIERLKPQRQRFLDLGFWMKVYSWNAEAGQFGLIVLLFSSLLLAGWAAYFFLRYIKPHGASGRSEAFFRAAGLVGGLGLLVSPLTIYISYQPFAALFNGFTKGSGSVDVAWLRTFWSFAESPLVMHRVFSPSNRWGALLVFAACLLVIEIYRFFSSRGPAQETV